MWRTRLALATVAAVGVAASPPACRAGLGSFQVNISDVFEGATCYGRRYPDLEYAFCSKDECNVQALHRHFQSHGRREGRRFGCEAAPLTDHFATLAAAFAGTGRGRAPYW